LNSYPCSGPGVENTTQCSHEQLGKSIQKIPGGLGGYRNRNLCPAACKHMHMTCKFKNTHTTHTDTQKHTQTHADTHRHTQTHTETHRDTHEPHKHTRRHKHTHIEKCKRIPSVPVMHKNNTMLRRRTNIFPRTFATLVSKTLKIIRHDALQRLHLFYALRPRSPSIFDILWRF